MPKIKLLVMDVDGTLTDGKIYLSESGEEMKAFSIKDGLGIVKLAKHGIIPAIITGRKSEVVSRRARELRIEEVYQGVAEKTEILDMLAKKYECTLREIAYIGDDENDLSTINMCGVSACPKDAMESVQQQVSYCCRSIGGNGAVREFIEYLLKQQW